MTRLELLERLLQQISDSCDTLANFAANAANQSDDVSEQHAFYAVEAMAERIGAVAALPLGLQVAVEHIVGRDLAQAIVGNEPARGSVRRGQRVASTPSADAEQSLLADADRVEIVRTATVELLDKLVQMNEEIEAGGRGNHARSVWKAGFDALKQRADVALSAVDDQFEGTPALAARLAALPPVMTEQEPEDKRDQLTKGDRS